MSRYEVEVAKYKVLRQAFRVGNENGKRNLDWCFKGEQRNEYFVWNGTIRS